MNDIDFSHYLRYCEESGKLFWIVDLGYQAKSGMEAGNVKSCGKYRTFKLKGKRYYSHRIAWQLAHGVEIPDGLCIDHIDGDGLNNKIENLRVVSLSDNQRNSKKPKNNTSGHLNITARKDGKYLVHVAGKHIGTYGDLNSAIASRDSKLKALGFHENHGR